MTTATPDGATVAAFDGKTSNDVRELAQNVFRKRVEQRAVIAALRQAKRPEYASISKHLLSRIGAIVAVTPCDELLSRLDKLRDRAKTQLGELLTLLKGTSNWQEQYQKFVDAELVSAQQVGGAPRRWPVLFGTRGPGVEPDEAVVKSYLLRLLAGIARERRESA